MIVQNLAACVLKGENPSTIPFQEVAGQKIVVNRDAAAKLHITFPPNVIKSAQA